MSNLEEKKDKLRELYSMVDQCKKCALGYEMESPRPRPRGTIRDHQVVAVGMAPGKIEEQKGKYFVGPAGKENTPLPPQAILGCMQHIKEELGILEPRIILSVGQPPTSELLMNITPKTPMGSLVGVHSDNFSDIVPKSVEKIIVIYHPATFLYPKDPEVGKKMTAKQMAALSALKDELHG